MSWAQIQVWHPYVEMFPFGQDFVLPISKFDAIMLPMSRGQREMVHHRTPKFNGRSGMEILVPSLLGHCTFPKLTPTFEKQIPNLKHCSKF